MKSLSRAASLFLDALIIALILTWLAGGIPWHGHLLLKHGADPRRAAVLLTLLAAWLSSRTRHKSRVIFFVSRIHGLLLQSRWRWGILGVTFLGSVAVSIAQTLALRYPLYDVGLFHQILWSLANGHAFASSISKAGDFLQDHLSPSLALLTPFFWISQSSPLTLAFLHSSLIFGGVAAWVYLAERLSGLTESKRNQLAAATLIFSLSFESLWGNLRWGFHENSIYFCSFSWAIAFLILENIPPILLLLLFLVAAASHLPLAAGIDVSLT